MFHCDESCSKNRFCGIQSQPKEGAMIARVSLAPDSRLAGDNAPRERLYFLQKSEDAARPSSSATETCCRTLSPACSSFTDWSIDETKRPMKHPCPVDS